MWYHFTIYPLHCIFPISIYKRIILINFPYQLPYQFSVFLYRKEPWKQCHSCLYFPCLLLHIFSLKTVLSSLLSRSIFLNYVPPLDSVKRRSFPRPHNSEISALVFTGWVAPPQKKELRPRVKCSPGTYARLLDYIPGNQNPIIFC